MEDVEMSAEEEHHPENHLNNEEGNLKDGEIWVHLYDSKENKSQLKGTVKVKV